MRAVGERELNGYTIFDQKQNIKKIHLDKISIYITNTLTSFEL